MGQSISVTQFYLSGRKNFTQTGYLNHVAKYESSVQKSACILPGQEGDDGVRMDGKVVAVTGANSGIGKEIATYAAAKGAKLYMICRSKDRAEKAREEISKLTKNDNISILLADVGELAQVRRIAKELQEKETKLDCLVCNAGILVRDRVESSDGYEGTFASHLLGGSYLLSHLLLPQLKAPDQGGGRVIFVSSGGMLTTKFPDWETGAGIKKSDHFDGDLSYAYAKRGQVLLGEKLSQTIPEITWVSSHPGWVDTPAVNAAYGDKKKYLEPLRTAWEGSEGISWLMAVDKSKITPGAFYLDREPQSKHIAGPFNSEGSFTKNSEAEVQELLDKLEKACAMDDSSSAGS